MLKDELSTTKPPKLVDRVKKLHKLHQITQQQIEAFVKATKIEEISKQQRQNTVEIADLFCGSGFGAQLVLKKAIQLNNPLHIHLIDMNKKLLDVAERELLYIIGKSKKQDHIVTLHKKKLNGHKLPFKTGQLDLVVIKMGLHETQKESQQNIINESFRSLRTSGILVIWDTFPSKDKNLNDLSGFNQIIRTKDRLAGFAEMVKNRYFSSKEEILQMIRIAGFKNVTSIYEWDRTWKSISRLHTELNGNLNKLQQLNKKIDKIFESREIKDQFKFKQETSSKGIQGRSFLIQNGILQAIKVK